jgi:ATP-binding cassette, subfamily B (MDR/TAP), member 1
MGFFDKPENGTGELVARLDGIPNSLMELLGINIGIILVAATNIVASCILAIAVGWKLGLVITFGALPIMIGFGILRIRLDISMEKRNAAWFARSAGVATEAVSSIRTVSSLTMEHNTLEKYESQLNNVLRNSWKTLLWTMFWYSLASSVQFLSMALGFW